MSGPKGIGYQVVSTEELARREAERIRTRVLTRLRQAREGSGRTVDLGASPDVSRIATMALANLRHLEQEVERYASAVTEAVAAARVAEGLRRLRGSGSEIARSVQLEVSGKARPKVEPVEAADGSEDLTPDRLRARAQQAAETALSHGVEPGQVEGLLAPVEKCLAGGDLRRAGLLVTQLEASVVADVRAARGLARLERLRQDCLARHAAVTGDEADRLRERLRAATDAEQVTQIGLELDRLAEADDKEADRLFVLRAAREALETLGYRVEVDQAAPDVPRFTATRADWPRHGLNLLFPEGSSTFHTAPVAFAETDPRDDVAFEAASCADLTQLEAALAAQGVLTERVHEKQPGELPVRREVHTGASRRRTRNAERSRER
jgi:hypothetical protein